jgi:hypothetical protein
MDVWSDLAVPTNCPTAATPGPRHEPRIAGRLVVVAVEEAASAEALRWAFDEAVMRGGELEVIQVIRPDASCAEMSSQQRDLSETLADWRSDYPGLAIRIDVTLGDPTLLLIASSADAESVVAGHTHAAVSGSRS